MEEIQPLLDRLERHAKKEPDHLEYVCLTQLDAARILELHAQATQDRAERESNADYTIALEEKVERLLTQQSQDRAGKDPYEELGKVELERQRFREALQYIAHGVDNARAVAWDALAASPGISEGDPGSSSMKPGKGAETELLGADLADPERVDAELRMRAEIHGSHPSTATRDPEASPHRR